MRADANAGLLKELARGCLPRGFTRFNGASRRDPAPPAVPDQQYLFKALVEEPHLRRQRAIGDFCVAATEGLVSEERLG